MKAGVFGFASSPAGLNSGVVGPSNSTSGRGVFGFAAATSGTVYGVRGESNSPSAYGVYSQGNAHVEGNLTVSGTLSNGGGSFKIDHPLDPTNKYLSHSFEPELPNELKLG